MVLRDMVDTADSHTVAEVDYQGCSEAARWDAPEPFAVPVQAHSKDMPFDL